MLKTEGRKKVLYDIVLNMAAAAIPIAILQLVIYPWVARQISGDAYGLMLTIYSIWIMISNSLGIVLNNIKLLRHQEYVDMGIQGDIHVLLRRWACASSIIVFIITWLYFGSFEPPHLFLGVFVSICILLKAYLEVGFRIQLNFVLILANSVILGAGFFIGFLFFKTFGYWELIFLLGYGLSTVFCAIRTHLLKEPFVKTAIFKSVSKDAYSLLLSAVITNMINYADKLVLYPLMGGTAVSIYYTATIIGKITGMLTGPINSVILSYISRWDKSKANFFTRVILIGLIIITIGYAFTLILARPIIGFLFPQWVDAVMEIIPLTTTTIMLNVLASILQPFVLKFCNMEWQIVISAIGSATYFLSAIVLWKFFGLEGFCIGTIIGIVVKIVIMISVYYKSNNMKIKQTN